MLSFDTDGEFSANYKLLIGSILPRPIAVVGTINEDGSNNLAPFSFFTTVSAKPMIVVLGPMIKSSTGEIKDTSRNIEREKEFTISMVSENIMDEINLCSTELPYGDDEFKFSGLTPVDSEKVKAKRIKESPIHFECKLRDIIKYGDKPGAGWLITGEVVKVHVREEIYDNGRIDTQKWKPIGRGAGNDWFKTDHVIERARLMKAQIQK